MAEDDNTKTESYLDGEWHYFHCSPSDFPTPEPKKNPDWERGLAAYKKHKDLMAREKP